MSSKAIRRRQEEDEEEEEEEEMSKLPSDSPVLTVTQQLHAVL